MLNVLKQFYIFFKVIHFYTKNYYWNFLLNINLPKLANKLKYKIDFGICTEHLIAIVYE